MPLEKLRKYDKILKRFINNIVKLQSLNQKYSRLKFLNVVNLNLLTTK